MSVRALKYFSFSMLSLAFLISLFTLGKVLGRNSVDTDTIIDTDQGVFRLRCKNQECYCADLNLKTNAPVRYCRALLKGTK